MSRENVELTYGGFDAFNRRDLDAFLARMDPGVEFTPYERALEGLGPYRGHRGVRTWWEESSAALPDLRAQLYEVRDLGDVTLVNGRLRGTGAQSGAPIERTLWMVMRWQRGRIIWWRAFSTEGEALEAVGLSE